MNYLRIGEQIERKRMERGVAKDDVMTIACALIDSASNKLICK